MTANDILEIIRSRAMAKRRDAQQLERDTFDRLLVTEQARTLEELLGELRRLARKEPSSGFSPDHLRQIEEQGSRCAADAKRQADAMERTP